MDITYRRAIISDVEMLVENRIAFLRELSASGDAEATAALRNSLEEYFRVSISDGTYVSWIAMVGDEVAGTGGMTVRIQPANYRCLSGRIGYIMNMYTKHAYRRRGIGSAILEKLLATARELGLELVELHATPDGDPVYRAHGFAEPKSIVLEKHL